MTFEEYQVRASLTSVYPNTEQFQALMQRALGLASEAGELCAILNRTARDHQSLLTDDDVEHLQLELGDILWMVSEMCTVLGVDLELVVEKNLRKLASRARRGTLRGKGDDR